MKYNKLVRDKIPEILKQNGTVPVTHVASDDEYWQKLKEKLQEEFDEFMKDSNEEELADILEVIYALCAFKKIGKEKLELLRKEKTETRGGYKGSAGHRPAVFAGRCAKVRRLNSFLPAPWFRT